MKHHSTPHLRLTQAVSYLASNLIAAAARRINRRTPKRQDHLTSALAKTLRNPVPYYGLAQTFFYSGELLRKFRDANALAYARRLNLVKPRIGNFVALRRKEFWLAGLERKR